MDIFKAIENKDFESFKTLIQNGADVLQKNNLSKAPIFLLIERDLVEMLDYLLQRSSISAQMGLSYMDSNPVQYALKANKCEIVAKLFEYDPDLPNTLGGEGETFLTRAIYDSAKYQREKDAYGERVENKKIKCLIPLSDLTVTDQWKNTPLEKAVWEGNIKAIYWLLKSGKADKNTACAHDSAEIPLTKAIYLYAHYQERSIEVIKALFAMCVDPFSLHNDRSPLEVAKSLEYTQIKDMLVEYIEFNSCGGDYKTLPELPELS